MWVYKRFFSTNLSLDLLRKNEAVLLRVELLCIFCTLFWDSKLSDVSLSLHAQEPKCQLPCFYGEIVKITCILNLNQKGNTYKVSCFVPLANDRYKQDLFHVVHKCVKIVRLLNKSQYSRCSIFVTLLKPVIHLRQRNQHITVVLFWEITFVENRSNRI